MRLFCCVRANFCELCTDFCFCSLITFVKLVCECCFGTGVNYFKFCIGVIPMATADRLIYICNIVAKVCAVSCFSFSHVRE